MPRFTNTMGQVIVCSNPRKLLMAEYHLSLREYEWIPSHDYLSNSWLWARKLCLWLPLFQTIEVIEDQTTEVGLAAGAWWRHCDDTMVWSRNHNNLIDLRLKLEELARLLPQR